MAVLLRALGVRGLRQVLMERSELQAVTLATKATEPRKKKKVKGAEILNRDSPTAEITSTQRANLLSKKTLLLFPTKALGPIPFLGETLSSTQNTLEDGEPSVAASHAGVSRDPVAKIPVSAEEEADSSSDSSSDSDEESVTEDDGQSPTESPKCVPVRSSTDRAAERDPVRSSTDRAAERDPVRSSTDRAAERDPVRSSTDRAAERISDRSKKPGGESQELSAEIKVPVSKDSTCTGWSSGEERGPQTGHTQSITQRKQVLSSSQTCAGVKATVTESRAGSVPITKSITPEPTASSPPREWVLPAQSETPERQHQTAKEGTPEATPPPLAETPLEPMGMPVEEPVEEVLDTSTYKNTQHHDYTPLTFVDLDVEMAKYRLPQPSSGRLSPRH
ncbi:uncharacterized protein ndufv3 [Mustelus asterias]